MMEYILIRDLDICVCMKEIWSEQALNQNETLLTCEKLPTTRLKIQQKKKSIAYPTLTPNKWPDIEHAQANFWYCWQTNRELI